MLKKYLIIVMNDNLIKLAAMSYNFINSHSSDIITRQRKTTIHDAIAYKLLYTQKDKTQLDVTAQLNYFKDTKINRVTYDSRAKSLDNTFLLSYYHFLEDSINKLFPSNNAIPIIAVDGTYGAAYATTKNQNMNPTKSKDIFKFLNIGFFNISDNTPMLLESSDIKSERSCLITKMFNFKDNTIFICDRGFYSGEVIDTFFNNNQLFICRLNKNSLLIDNQQQDHSANVNNNNVRIINYITNGNEYHLITNLSIEYTKSDIQQLYKRRWDIEEYFKYIKHNYKMSTMFERDWESIKSAVISNLIVSKLVYLIISINKDKEKDNKRINKNFLTRQVFSQFLLKFIYNKELTDSYVITFLTTAINIIQSHIGCSNSRTSKYPYTKWYIKSYYKKYIYEE